MAKIEQYEKKLVGKKLMFYCVTCRKKHTATVDKIVKKGKAIFAVSKCDKHGNSLWKIVARA